MSRTPDIPLRDKIALTVPEAAALLSVSDAHLWQFVDAGQIRTFRLGRKVLIARATLEQVVAEGLPERKEGFHGTR